jgi:hypothetical protein
MHLFVVIACYAAAALAVVSVGVIGASMLTSSTETVTADAQRPKLVRRADQNPGEQQPAGAPRPGAAFRYGPEVNHGRGDTPVNYAQQALKEARSAYAWAPAGRYKQNPERRYRGGRMVDHGVQPSGH